MRATKGNNSSVARNGSDIARGCEPPGPGLIIGVAASLVAIGALAFSILLLLVRLRLASLRTALASGLVIGVAIAALTVVSRIFRTFALSFLESVAVDLVFRPLPPALPG